MKKISIIGVGPGREDLLTLEARAAIDAADAVFAFERHRALAKDALPLEPLATADERILALAREDRRVAVLVSGDPCLYSLLGLLRRKLGAENILVLPGLGSIQALCAAAGVLWQDAAILSGHGRPLSVSALGHTVRTHARSILFCDAQRDAVWAAKALLAEGLEHTGMTVGERLSYPDQALTRGRPCEISEGHFDSLCLVLIENEAPVSGLPAMGLDDSIFTRGKIPMTKREIRMQVLAELALTPDAVVWDLGAGTGSVSVECARLCPLGEVYAVERKPEGVALIRANAEKLRVHNLIAVEGNAVEKAAELPTPTHVFIGGSGGQMPLLFDALRARGKNIRVVATAVTTESMAELTTLFAALKDVHMTQIAVSRVESAGRYHLMQALNPVWIASGVIAHEE